MCGIAGFCNHPTNWKENIRRMNERMLHRGPDAGGFWANEDASVVFGHRRLSIVDLSENGAQPMQSASGRYMCVYNGEIYNYKVIRDKLLAEHKVTAFLDTVDSVQEGSDSAEMNIKTKLTIMGCTTNMRGSMSYTGKERTQMFDVFVDGETLIPDVDYRVVYYDNVNVGTAKVTVIGMGQYCDSADFQFDITLKSDNVMVIKPQELNNKSIVSGKPTMKAQGYEVAEAVKDKLDHTSHSGPATVVNYNSPSQVIAKARANMRDLRVRSYRELTGETIYGAWL